ncbi:HEPN domain-containing protein [Methanobrevibacter sp.]|uniref:HEPN domain-containing protein n=1 Tax=Methanobrevibacter sp. TaxID=66852 RepID=UPI0025FD3B39|nr:HEPN domain-containing protein [Methanobrevibacter sp.]MBQ2961608.1 HEPN domain-containing protein [Methanobrevibacter sp.]
MKNISEKEEYQRSAVGRFYYAAFGLVKNYYEENHHKTVPSNDGHSFLINELEKSYGSEKSLGENLRKMRKYRNFADYNNKFFLKNVEGTEEIFHEIVGLLKNLKMNKKSK